MTALSLDDLRSLLAYDPLTGMFHWTENKGRARAGQQAGTAHSKGYVTIRVAGYLYLAHRIAWAFVHGRWPPKEIDHGDYPGLDSKHPPNIF